MSLNKIWKFPLDFVDNQVVSMPSAYAILSVGHDAGGQICMWAAVTDDAPVTDVEIRIVGTGTGLPRLGTYIGTIVDSESGFVWHFFTGPGHSGNMPRDNAFHYLTRGNES